MSAFWNDCAVLNLNQDILTVLNLDGRLQWFIYRELRTFKWTLERLAWAVQTVSTAAAGRNHSGGNTGAMYTLGLSCSMVGQSVVCWPHTMLHFLFSPEPVSARRPIMLKILQCSCMYICRHIGRIDTHEQTEKTYLVHFAAILYYQRPCPTFSK